MKSELIVSGNIPAVAWPEGAVSEGVRMLRQEILFGLAKLISLNLPGGPALEDENIEFAVLAWVEALEFDKEWDAEADRPRIRKAFAELEGRTDFSTPAALRTILNRPQPGYIPTHEENVARREEERREGEERREADAEHAARYAPQPETPEMLAARLKRGRKKLREMREMVQIRHAAAVVRDAKAKLAEGRGA